MIVPSCTEKNRKKIIYIMKTTSFRFFLAALAATAALVGCAKEITPPSFENDKVNPEGSRIIAVSFAPQTKTYLGNDGFQPKFEDGKDTVLISNTNALDTCVVSVKDNKATISTNLTGPLTAVYPYTAAGLNGNNSTQIDTVLVSTVQSGKFADANICMAKMKSENDESLSFENKTAVFCIYPPTDNPEYVEVSADGFEIANDVPTGSTHTSLETIHVNTTTADSVYVSILVPDGLKVSDLTFSDGTNEKSVTTGAPANKEIAAGTLYTVTDKNWESPEADIPDGALEGVFTVGAGPDGEAGTADDIKVHFSQGNLYCTRTGSEGNWEYTFNFDVNQWSYHCIGISDFTYEDSEESTVSEVDFPTTFPGMIYENNTSGLFQWNSTKDDGTADSEDYGAFTTLGSSSIIGSNTNILEFGNVFGGGSIWRTLTISEWDYLINTRKIKGETSYGKTCVFVTLASPAVSGLIVFPDGYAGTTEAAELTTIPEGCVFLPAAGYRGTDYVAGGGIYGSYWSSTASNTVNACSINFYDGEACTVNDRRFYGESVRLVTDVSAAPTPTPEDGTRGKLNGHDYVVVDGIKWATQNLAITTSGKKAWKGGNTSSAVKVPGTNEDVIVGDYFQWAANIGYCGNGSDFDKGLLIYTSFTNQYCVDGGDGNEFTFKSAGDGKTYYFHTSSYGNSVGISPYYSDESGCIKYNNDDKTERPYLEKSDDVANIILGGDWRMPTSDEFQAMKDATYWYWDDTDKGYYVYAPASGDEGGLNGKKSDKETDVTGSYDKSNALLFFPATGSVDMDNLAQVTSSGRYWASTFRTDLNGAYRLNSNSNNVIPQNSFYRYEGMPIRPVAD